MISAEKNVLATSETVLALVDDPQKYVYRQSVDRNYVPHTHTHTHWPQ